MAGALTWIVENWNKMQHVFFSLRFVWNSTLVLRTFPPKVRNLINCLFFLLPCIQSENKVYPKVPRSTYYIWSQEHPNSPVIYEINTYVQRHNLSRPVQQAHSSPEQICSFHCQWPAQSSNRHTTEHEQLQQSSCTFKLQKLCEWGTERGCVAQVGQELPAQENVNTCAPTMQHQNEVLGQNTAKARIYLCLQRFTDINKAWAFFFFFFKLADYLKRHFNLQFCFY